MSKLLDHIEVVIGDTDDELEKEVSVHFTIGTKGVIKIPVEAKLQGVEEQVLKNVVRGLAEKIETRVKELVVEEDEKPRIVVPDGR